MADADPLHYTLLETALAHYAFAAETDRAVSPQMKSTARSSIDEVRRSAIRTGDDKLLRLCEKAAQKVGELERGSLNGPFTAQD
jgi:hypothetical protein